MAGSVTGAPILLTIRHSALTISFEVTTHRLRDFVGENIVYLADMAYRVLSGGCFRTHSSARRDQSVDPVAASNLTVVPGLSRSAGDREIDAPRGRLVCQVDGNIAIRKAVLDSQAVHEFCHSRFFGEGS